ncbi:hypothetical protein V866_007564 [Kwoniella sp. B9012]|uniref:Uncharacterized protein n=1 Tax=Kwoniella europaea PYCC6329 TaxID=1423913 RepID=A0AAX4KNT3_9TREE
MKITKIQKALQGFISPYETVAKEEYSDECESDLGRFGKSRKHLGPYLPLSSALPSQYPPYPIWPQPPTATPNKSVEDDWEQISNPTESD